MKKFGIISGLFLLIVLTCNFPLEAQRGMRGMMMDSVRMNRMRGMMMDSVRMNRMRGMMMDSVRMSRMSGGFDMGQNRGPGFKPDSLGMRRGMRPGRGQFGLYPMGPGMFPGPGFGMRGQMHPGPMRGRMGRGSGNDHMMGMMGRGMQPIPGEGMNNQRQRPGMRMFGNIPDITDKQKKNIDELMQKQQDEMKKLRDEMMTKMKGIRDSHRAKIMDLLTPEQKKWFEDNTGNPPKK
jgi:hypothetical protein